MKNIKNIKIALLVTVLFFIIPAKPGNAIPAFARKYQISCQVCHSPAMPRLKPFGDDFAGNGFRLTEYESPRYLSRPVMTSFHFSGSFLFNKDRWFCLL